MLGGNSARGHRIINAVDPSVCVGCGECIADCPHALFARNENGKAVYVDPQGYCIHCGHCVAVCPVDAARALGLGSCWIGFAVELAHPNRALRQLFGVPSGHRLYGVMSLGYPSVTCPRVPPREPLR